MAYKYITVTPGLTSDTPKDIWIDGYNNLINDNFDYATSASSILCETTFASGSLVSVKSRVNSVINSATGEKLDDDFKLLLFKPGQVVELGYKFYFNNNYWIVTNISTIKSTAPSCTVRRCNNVLKWIDDNGNYFSEPCVIDYKVSSPSNSVTDPVTPEGTIRLITQLNSRTQLIKENQRFLFGNANNWVAYQVNGGGIINFLNNNTTDNTSSQLVEFVLNKCAVNVNNDDLVNGVADYNKIVLSLSVLPASISGGVGDSFILSPSVTLNGNTTSKAVSFVTSSSPVASISGSVVSLISSGSCIVTASLVDNTSVTDTVAVVVNSPVVENDIRVTPLPSYILEGETQTYSCYLFNNGVQGADVFTFAVANDNVPIDKYELITINGNSFSLENKEYYIDNSLDINCVSGSLTKQVSILLKGAW